MSANVEGLDARRDDSGRAAPPAPYVSRPSLALARERAAHEVEKPAAHEVDEPAPHESDQSGARDVDAPASRAAAAARAELLAQTARAAFRRRLARLERRLRSCREVPPSACRHALATALADDAACREASLTRELALSIRGDSIADARVRPVLDAGCRDWKAVVASALDGTAEAPKAALLADLLGYVSAGVTNKLGPAERAAEFDRLVTFLLDAAAR